ncbi:MAG TPA: helix-turn-helix domain-containing protein, partial [Pseudonocardiaceae bacterium]|nr:helix-turn-helix domain-containing protein [Pseudonocardiaceae bacterium]
AQTGRSYGWTHRLLRESGAALRGRGGAHPPRQT